jgi:RimJ/RimL family protein N-acetyltransferase
VVVLKATVLETPRLRLRFLQSDNDSDHALYRDLYMDPAVMRRIADPLSSEAAARGFANACRHNGRDSPGHRFWRVDDMASQARVGLAALRRDGARAEIGVMLFSEWWNRGACSEIFVVLLQHAFTRLDVEAVDAQSAQDDGLPIIERLLQPFGFIRTQTATADGMGHWELPRAVWQATSSAGQSPASTPAIPTP